MALRTEPANLFADPLFPHRLIVSSCSNCTPRLRSPRSSNTPAFVQHSCVRPPGPLRAVEPCVAPPEKCTVYIIRSERSPARHYIGLTSDLARRLEWHNAGFERVDGRAQSMDRPRVRAVHHRSSGGTVRAIPEIGVRPCLCETPPRVSFLPVAQASLRGHERRPGESTKPLVPTRRRSAVRASRTTGIPGD